MAINRCAGCGFLTVDAMEPTCLTERSLFPDEQEWFLRRHFEWNTNSHLEHWKPRPSYETKNGRESKNGSLPKNTLNKVATLNLKVQIAGFYLQIEGFLLEKFKVATLKFKAPIGFFSLPNVPNNYGWRPGRSNPA